MGGPPQGGGQGPHRGPPGGGSSLPGSILGMMQEQNSPQRSGSMPPSGAPHIDPRGMRAFPMFFCSWC